MMNEKAKRRGQQLAAPYGKNMGASHGVQPLEASGNAAYVVCVCERERERERERESAYIV
jgi:hypothetical protein